MHPELITLPGGFTIKTYGFFLMIGFLSAVWLAMKKADRVKADPDVILDLSFLSLIFGVGGARVFYVIHYWKSMYAHAPNKIMAVLDITQGGLEFLGGFLGALVAVLIYCALKKKENRISIRLYLDILAPSLMWGLAFGRLGCFFNGCCFGGICVTENQDHRSNQPTHRWATQFPFSSPAQWKQWEDRNVTVPAELITTGKGLLQPSLVPQTMMKMSVERREQPLREYRDMEILLKQTESEQPGSKKSLTLIDKLASLKKSATKHESKILPLRMAQKYPSRISPERKSSITELTDLSEEFSSLPIHPTQIYSVINAFLLYGFLTALFYVRKRHGVVIGAVIIMYPIPRILLETIRVDNPSDTGGLTISQFFSLAMIVLGISYLIALYKHMPERSPYAVAVKKE